MFSEPNCHPETNLRAEEKATYTVDPPLQPRPLVLLPQWNLAGTPGLASTCLALWVQMDLGWTAPRLELGFGDCLPIFLVWAQRRLPRPVSELPARSHYVTVYQALQRTLDATAPLGLGVSCNSRVNP